MSNLDLIFTVRNEVAKVMFLHLSVILSTGGGLPQCMLGYHPPPGVGTPREQTTFPEQAPPTGADPSRAGTPSRRLLLRTVRILLECILVEKNIFPKTACPPGSTTALSFFNIQLSGVDTPRGGDTRTVSAVIKLNKTCTQRWLAPKNIFLAPSRPNEPPSDFWLFATHIWP